MFFGLEGMLRVSGVGVQFRIQHFGACRVGCICSRSKVLEKVASSTCHVLREKLCVLDLCVCVYIRV